MSRPAKLTLLGTSLFAGLTVAFVHWQQKVEKEVCFSLPSHLLLVYPCGLSG